MAHPLKHKYSFARMVRTRHVRSPLAGWHFEETCTYAGHFSTRMVVAPRRFTNRSRWLDEMTFRTDGSVPLCKTFNASISFPPHAFKQLAKRLLIAFGTVACLTLAGSGIGIWSLAKVDQATREPIEFSGASERLVADAFCLQAINAERYKAVALSSEPEVGEILDADIQRGEDRFQFLLKELDARLKATCPCGPTMRPRTFSRRRSRSTSSCASNVAARRLMPETRLKRQPRWPSKVAR